jgi:hypothetical protein
MKLLVVDDDSLLALDQIVWLPRSIYRAKRSDTVTNGRTRLLWKMISGRIRNDCISLPTSIM